METLYTNRREDSRWLAVQFRKTKVNNVLPRKPWTDIDKQYIKDNYTDKESMIRIANYLKRTVIAVEAQVYRLKLTYSRQTLKKSYMPKQAPWITNRMNRMQELISFLQYVTRVAPERTYLIETAKTELKNLSGL